MALRRPQSMCWACQCRQQLVGRRRWSASANNRLEATALDAPEQDNVYWFEAGRTKQDEKPLDYDTNQGRSDEHSTAITSQFAEAMSSLDALYKTRDTRAAILRSLSRPEIVVDERSPDVCAPPKAKRAPPVSGSIETISTLPYDIFRRNLRAAIGEKAIRNVLRMQLLQVTSTKDLLRIVATVARSRDLARHLLVNEDAIARAMYRCRAHESDPRVLRTLNAVLWRFNHADIAVSSGRRLLTVGLKFAARTRSLHYMQRYLKEYKARGWRMNTNTFRAIIAKFSIGHRGLGEIRNGRWRRSDLLQVLTGFSNCADLALSEQYHLETFMDREDWHFLHKWIAVLARCKASETIWREWETWQASEAYRLPKRLGGFRMTSRTRGEYWFVEQMAMSGDTEKAWKIFETTDIPFDSLKERVTTRLLEKPEYASVWTQHMRDALLQKYDRHLRSIEQALGVEWRPDEIEGQGCHRPVENQEEVLEALADGDWKEAEYPGFPYDDIPAMLPDGERQLHDAKEEGLAC